MSFKKTFILFTNMKKTYHTIIHYRQTALHLKPKLAWLMNNLLYRNLEWKLIIYNNIIIIIILTL